MFVEAQCVSLQAEGQSHQLGELDDWKAKYFFEFFFNLSLTGIEIDMTKRAGHNNSIGPHTLCILKNLLA